MHRRKQLGLALILVASTVIQLMLLSGARVASAATPGTGGAFVPDRARLIDTRAAGGGGSLSSTVWRSFPVVGKAGLPTSGISAVVLSLTSTNANANGYLQGAPSGTLPPSLVSYMGWEAGENHTNTAIIAPGSDGAIQLRSMGSSVDLVIDVQGYYTLGNGSAAPGGFVPINGSRVADTRIGLGVPQQRLATSGSLGLDATTNGALVPGEASSAYVSVTVVSPTAGGYFTVHTPGTTSAFPTYNFAGDSNATIGLTAPVDSSGRFVIDLKFGGPVDIVVDVEGYFASGSSGALYNPAEGRAYDSRTSGRTQLAPNEARLIQVANLQGIPAVKAGLVAAVAAQIGVIGPADFPGYLVAWTPGKEEPNTSVVNSSDGSLALIQPSSSDTIYVRNKSAQAIDLVIDLEGWYTYPTGNSASLNVTSTPDGWLHYQNLETESMPLQDATTSTVSGVVGSDGFCTFSQDLTQPAYDAYLIEETDYNPTTCQATLRSGGMTNAQEDSLRAAPDASASEYDNLLTGSVSAPAESSYTGSGAALRGLGSAHSKSWFLDPLYLTITSLSANLQWPLGNAGGTVSYKYVPYKFAWDEWTVPVKKLPPARSVYRLDGTKGWFLEGQTESHNNDFERYVIIATGAAGWAACGFDTSTAIFKHDDAVSGFVDGSWTARYSMSKRGGCSDLVRYRHDLSTGWRN